MENGSPAILRYASTVPFEPRRRWQSAYRYTLAWYVFVGICYIAIYAQSQVRHLGRFHSAAAISNLDRLAVDVTQTPISRPLLALLGIGACIGFRRAYLGQPHKRLIGTCAILMICLLLLRIVGDIYVTWIAKVDLVASGRPYKFFAFWGAEWALTDIAVCLFLSAPLLVLALLSLLKNRQKRDAMRRIESNPAVCGGAPCITGTRMAVWMLEEARRQGLSEHDLLRAYPNLSPEDLDAAWAYARAHPDEIDEQIRENEGA